MAQIRVRKKAAPIERANSGIVPIVLVLALGLAGTSLAKNGKQTPDELLAGVKPWAASLAANLAASRQGGPKDPPLQHGYLINGQAWKLADVPTVTIFQPDEMVRVGEAHGFAVVVNRMRGLPGLGKHPHAFDRLYLALAPGRYAALSLRDDP